MRFATRNSDGLFGERTRRVGRPVRRNSAFTLAEVLAAMVFLAIVIPAAVEALHVASLAGEVAARKGAAVNIADRILNESIITTNWTGSVQSGVVTQDALNYQWKLTAQNWPEDAMELLIAQVTFQAQGKNYSVDLSTLANPSAATTGLTP